LHYATQFSETLRDEDVPATAEAADGNSLRK
jgi:hypothetical protein